MLGHITKLDYTSSVHVKQSSHFYFYVVARPLVVSIFKSKLYLYALLLLGMKDKGIEPVGKE